MLRAFVLLIFLLPSICSAEVFVREGSDTWGQQIAARWGIPGFGRSIAVVVAVGDFRGGWKPLEAPKRDAERMFNFLKDEAQFDIIYKLTDEDVDYKALRFLMEEELANSTGSNDRVLFYFSGHGTQRELFGGRVKGYLPLQHSSTNGWSSMISMDDIEDWWEAIAHTKQSLFILDACFSGLGLQSKGDDFRRRTISELNKRGHHIIAAGTANQESYASLSRWGGSLFTTALLEAMSGAADDPAGSIPRDGVVSMKELWDYVDKRVRSETPPNAMNPQLAAFEFNSSGEFFFLNSSHRPTRLTDVPLGGEVQSKGSPQTIPSTAVPDVRTPASERERSFQEAIDSVPGSRGYIDERGRRVIVRPAEIGIPTYRIRPLPSE